MEICVARSDPIHKRGILFRTIFPRYLDARRVLGDRHHHPSLHPTIMPVPTEFAIPVTSEDPKKKKKTEEEKTADEKKAGTSKKKDEEDVDELVRATAVVSRSFAYHGTV